MLQHVKSEMRLRVRYLLLLPSLSAACAVFLLTVEALVGGRLQEFLLRPRSLR